MEKSWQKDTIFFDYNRAKKIALEKNRAVTFNPVVSGLQICYFFKKKDKENNIENLIGILPENMKDFFATTFLRLPKNIDFFNSNINTHRKAKRYTEILNNINKKRCGCRVTRPAIKTAFLILPFFQFTQRNKNYSRNCKQTAYNLNLRGKRTEIYIGAGKHKKAPYTANNGRL